MTLIGNHLSQIYYSQGSGKTHIHQMGLWSIMSDRPSYTIHPQPSSVSGSGCMDVCIDRLYGTSTNF